MNWNYKETEDIPADSKYQRSEIEEEHQRARNRGYILVTHKFTKRGQDMWGDMTFDQIVISDFDTNKTIATFEDDEMDEANCHYEENRLWHAKCYMP